MIHENSQALSRATPKAKVENELSSQVNIEQRPYHDGSLSPSINEHAEHSNDDKVQEGTIIELGLSSSPTRVMREVRSKA